MSAWYLLPAVVFGMGLGQLLIELFRSHRHQWSQWEDHPQTRIVIDVRHCKVCNKRQTRQP